MKYDRVKMSKAIPVRLDDALLQRIKAVSEKLGEPQSTVMRIATRVGLDQLEKVFSAGAPPNLSSLIYPAHRDEVTAIEDRPKKTKPKAA